MSALRRAKTRLRNRMKNCLLEALMHVSSKEESQIIDRAVKQWNLVLQRKLPKVQRSTPMHVTSVTTSDAQVN